MTFKTLQEMDIHGNLHGANGEKAYCPHCKIGYNRWGNLFNHVFKGAGCTQQGLAALPGPFLCPACAEESPNASALRLHCETKHTNTTPTCPGCGITYNRWGNLLNHVFGPSACPLATPRPQTKCSGCETYPGFKPRKVSSIQPSPLLMNDTQEEGVDPLEEIDPYPDDEEVKEVDPLADPLGGVSPPRIEESSSSNMGAVILG